MTNLDKTEKTTHKRVEDVAAPGAADLAASLWQPRQKPAIAHVHEKEKDQQLAWVKMTYDRQSGDLTATDVDSGKQLTIKAFSGHGIYGVGYEGGEGADGKYDAVQDEGPLPSGKYLIGKGYEHDGPPEGDNQWYRLYGSDGHRHFSYEKVDDHNGGFRSGINLHTGSISDGCLTVKSDVAPGDASYPHSVDFDGLHDMLDNTKPLKYKGKTYSGKLEVK